MTDTERQQPPERPDVPGHRVDAVIGTGASAVVWSGLDATGRRVAIKVPHLVRDELDLQQSSAEQHVLLAVKHDHLVPLRSVVPLADGREALVFDLVTGAQLAGMVRSRGHLRPGEVVTVLTPVCEAVAHLHAAEVTVMLEGEMSACRPPAACRWATASHTGVSTVTTSPGRR